MDTEFTIQKWGRRYWALFERDELVCLTVYKKGALEVKRRLELGNSQKMPSVPFEVSLTVEPIRSLSVPA